MSSKTNNAREHPMRQPPVLRRREVVQKPDLGAVALRTKLARQERRKRSRQSARCQARVLVATAKLAAYTCSGCRLCGIPRRSTTNELTAREHHRTEEQRWHWRTNSIAI